MKNTVNKTATALKDKVSSAIKSVNNAVNKVISNTKTAIKTGVEKVKDAANRVSTLYRQATTSVKKAVSNAVSNVKQKVTQVVSSAKSAVKNATTAVKNSVKKVSETVSKYGGRIVKGTLGTLQAEAGAAQVYVGGALCATGIGAVIDVPLMIHGAADVVQGVGNTYYAIKGEDKEMSNFVQEGYKAAGRTVGRLIGGEKGAQVDEKIGSGVFVAVDVALSFVSGKAILKGAKEAKESTTFFKGVMKYLKLLQIM